MAPAISSLPVPVSPRIRTVVLLLATFFTMARTRLQRAAGAHDSVEVVDVLLRVPEILDLVAQAPVLDGLFDLELHLLDFEGLLHVVEGADLHGLDRGMDGAERRHQDDRRRRVKRLCRPQHVEPVAAAHLQIAEDDVVLPFVELLYRNVPVRRLVDIVPRVGQRADDTAAEGIMIIGDQDTTHSLPLISVGRAGKLDSCYLNNSWLLLTGSVTRKRVPPAIGAPTSMRPSWASTILRTIASPRPEPCGLVVKKGLKIRSHDVGRHAGSVVDDFNQQARARLRLAPEIGSSASRAARMRTVPRPPRASKAFVRRLVNN